MWGNQRAPGGAEARGRILTRPPLLRYSKIAEREGGRVTYRIVLHLQYKAPPVIFVALRNNKPGGYPWGNGRATAQTNGKLGGRSLQKKSSLQKKFSKGLPLRKPDALGVTKLRPAHGALRPHVRPGPKKAQNGSPTQNLSKKSAM